MMNFCYIHWNLNPEIVHFFGITLQYYGILFVGGLLLSLYVLDRIYKANGIPQGYLQILAVYCAIGIFAGARLGHCLFYEPNYYLSHPVEIFLPIAKNAEGSYIFIGYRGLASHGAALGLLIALLCYYLKTKQNLVRTLDHIALVAPLASGFIRLANLSNSEIIGKVTNVPWAFIFEKVDKLPRHPAQLYEAIAYFLFFGINMLLYKKYGLKKSYGFYFGLNLILIFTFRFFIEFLKEPQEIFEENMKYNMGQLLSLPFVLLGIVFLIVDFLHFKKEKNTNK